MDYEGGFSMRKFATAVAALATAGIAALGTVAATGGVAHAATDLSITGCETNGGLLTLGVIPNCQAPTGYIYNSTEIAVHVDKSFLTALLGVLGVGVRVKYALTCNVDGSEVTKYMGWTATSPADSTQVVDLSQAVGSPSPNQCAIEHLSATSLISLTVADLKLFTFGVYAVGDNGVPGAIWAQYPSDSEGARSTICADDTANGNSGTPIQAYQCEQDLADAWLQVNHQLIHNGDCMTNNGGNVTLEKCEGGQWPSPNQAWIVTGTPYSAGVIKQGRGCLSAPSSGHIETSQLTVEKCGAPGYVQLWKAPASTPL
jgi:Ricin-type beta-trefoil lectin domain